MKMQYTKPPFLTTSFSESGKCAKKRIDNVFSANKRAGTPIIAALALSALMCGALVACRDKSAIGIIGGSDGPTAVVVGRRAESNFDDEIEAVVHSALLAERDKYADAEFWAEGHVILKTKKSGNDIKVYAITSVGGYSFMNGMFIKDSGSGAIPTVITVTKKDGTYIAAPVEYPKDGSHYADSVKKMFPKSLRSEALEADEYYDALLMSEHAQAEEYLKAIGREAKIGSYRDLNAELPDIPTETANALDELQKSGKFNKYPIYIGNHEYIEDGVRYIYTTDFANGIITYTKTDESGAVVEKTEFLAYDGKVRSHVKQLE